jgi:alkylation response protein AidB-like acyl-CoA dehydrogenase
MGGDLPGIQTEVHDELRAVARDLLGKASPGDGTDWRKVADAGWLGLEAPEEFDGAGATFAEVAVVLEERGRAAASGPYLGAVVLGVGTLTLLEPGPGRDELLRESVSGSVVPTVAFSGDHIEMPFRIDRSRLRGHADFVPDLTDADRILVPALDSGGVPVIVDAGPAAIGLTRTAAPVLDVARCFGHLNADGAEVRESSVWRFAGDPADAVRRVLDRAALAVACDSLGLSEAMLDATVAYAGVRTQFGRPIGSFQAVKHACADMLVRVSVARRLVSAAVRALSGGDPESGVAVSMAKSYACEAAVDIAGKAMQLHGGIGYTWESGIHRYLKRAALNRSLFGPPAEHRARLAARYR